MKTCSNAGCKGAPARFHPGAKAVLCSPCQIEWGSLHIGWNHVACAGCKEKTAPNAWRVTGTVLCGDCRTAHALNAQAPVEALPVVAEVSPPPAQVAEVPPPAPVVEVPPLPAPVAEVSPPPPQRWAPFPDVVEWISHAEVIRDEDYDCECVPPGLTPEATLDDVIRQLPPGRYTVFACGDAPVGSERSFVVPAKPVASIVEKPPVEEPVTAPDPSPTVPLFPDPVADGRYLTAEEIYRINFYRVYPTAKSRTRRERLPLSAYRIAGSTSYFEITPETTAKDLAAQFGGGTFCVEAYDRNHRLLPGGRTISLSGKPREYEPDAPDEVPETTSATTVLFSLAAITQRVEALLAQDHAAATARVAPIVAACTAYVAATDHAAFARLAAATGLTPPAAAVDTPEEAALALVLAVEALPEVQIHFSRPRGGPGGATPTPPAPPSPPTAPPPAAPAAPASSASAQSGVFRSEVSRDPEMKVADGVLLQLSLAMSDAATVVSPPEDASESEEPAVSAESSEEAAVLDRIPQGGFPNIAENGDPILIVGGIVIPRRLSWIKKLVPDAEWADDYDRRPTRVIEACAARLKGGHVAGLLILNGCASHTTVNGLVADAKFGRVPYHLVGKGGQYQILRGLREIDTQLAKRAQRSA
jgi:hypothetical protein